MYKIKKDQYLKLIDNAIDLFMRPGIKDKQKYDIKEAMLGVKVGYIMKVLMIQKLIRWTMFLFIMYLISCGFLAYSLYF